MAAKQYDQFKCTIHNAKVKVEKIEDPRHQVVWCPYCMRDELVNLRVRLATSDDHRAALLRAIEIKQTSEPL